MFYIFGRRGNDDGKERPKKQERWGKNRRRKKDDKGYKVRQAQEVDFRNQEVAKREGSDGGGTNVRKERGNDQASL